MFLLSQQPPHGPDALSLGLGVASVVLVAGWTLTRWQRDRMRFTLMRTALEKGVTHFPGTPPYWLVSLRQGVTLLVLGIALAGLGGGAGWLARGVPMPVTATRAAPSTLAPTSQASVPPRGSYGERAEPDFGGPPPEDGPDDNFDFRPPRPPPRGPGGDRRGGFDRPPPRDGRDAGGPPPRGRPSEHTPEIERWHRAEVQKTLAMASVGIGFILGLLGVVRIVFARLEQRYTGENEDSRF